MRHKAARRAGRPVFVVVSAAGAAVLFASLLACVPVAGSTSAQNAARVFYEAVAAGDVGRAQAVAVVPVSQADLSEVRRNLFSQETTFAVASLDVGAGAESDQPGAPTFMALYGYTLTTGENRATDQPAIDEYQVSVERRDGRWVVTDWRWLRR